MRRDEESLELPGSIDDVAGLVTHLGDLYPELATLDKSKSALLVAVNQTVVDRSFKLSQDDEVAFFPPMTGG